MPFFHAWVNHRWRINQIRKIKDEARNKWMHIKEISKAFVLLRAFHCKGYIWSEGEFGRYGGKSNRGYEC